MRGQAPLLDGNAEAGRWSRRWKGWRLGRRWRAIRTRSRWHKVLWVLRGSWFLSLYVVLAGAAAVAQSQEIQSQEIQSPDIQSPDSTTSVVPSADSQQAEHFEKHIRPLLVRHCYECHSSASAEVKGGLRLDFKAALLQGGDSGPAIVPGNADESLLVAAVKHEGLEMPPGKKLTESEVGELMEWVARGAYDPRRLAPEADQVADETFEALYQSRREWWSLQPIQAVAAPNVDCQPTLGEIDRFIVAKLQSHRLELAAPADRRTLARRAHFALLGLPPSEQQLDEFLNDQHPQAWERLIDRLLASPHFGERWARHWMDVVRFTDTYGYEWDIPAKGAWRYRDYLIRAFNQDLPFDQLVREQLAGDLLPAPRLNPALGLNESLIGPMFYQLGEKRHGDSLEFNGIHQEMLDNKIDAFGKAFLGTTIACARCHDHKLDAVAQKDYYALCGLFLSSRWVTNTVELPERNAATRRELELIKQRLRPLLAELWMNNVAELSAESLQAAGGELTNRPLEDPAYPWAKATEGRAAGKEVATVWAEVATHYSSESARRIAENAAHFETVVDFREGAGQDWSIDGEGLQTIVPRGDFVVSLSGEKVLDGVLLGGLCTNSLSPRLNGAVRSPWTRQLGTGHLSFEVAGGEFAARRIVVDNAFLTERQQYLNDPFPTWQMVEGLSSQVERHVYVEFATKTSNPNFPPRVGLGGKCSEEQAADPQSWFQLSRVVKHVAPFKPHHELTSVAALFQGELAQSMEGIVESYRRLLRQAVMAWKDNTPSDDDVRVLNWALSTGLFDNLSSTLADSSEINDLIGQYRRREADLRAPATVNGMADCDPPFDYRLNVRGDYDQLGNLVPQGPIRLLADICGAGLPSNADDGNALAAEGRTAREDDLEPGGDLIRAHGRLELAELIASPGNPLTARVYVNRIWHWLFGAGLVGTPDDFGHLGEPPSHPELLDALAYRLVHEGWSTKRLIRSIVLSQAWQQSQSATAAAIEVDPSNRLLHHFAVQRLDAESLRDAMLSVSGGLDASLFGPAINPSRLNEDPQKRLFSGPLDGLGRRSIYTKITIMEPPRFLATFNQPAPKIPTGRRDVTNTPTQSLALLNDPFVVNQAQAWAMQLIARNDSCIETRLRHMFRKAFGREATPEELSRWSAAAGDFADSEEIVASERLASHSLWQTIAHAMFNTKEFLYVR